jgi:hypothetical protein
MAYVRKVLRVEFNDTVARIVLYLLTAMVLVAVGLAVAFGWMAFASMNEVVTYREMAQNSRLEVRQCLIQVERAHAKLEQMDTLFAYARGDAPPTSIGGD